LKIGKCERGVLKEDFRNILLRDSQFIEMKNFEKIREEEEEILFFSLKI